MIVINFHNDADDYNAAHSGDDDDDDDKHDVRPDICEHLGETNIGSQ